MDEPKPQEGESLESSTTPETQSPELGASNAAPQKVVSGSGKKSLADKVQALFRHFNIYFLLFVLLVLLALFVGFASYQTNKKNASSKDISGQGLNQEDLQNLKNTDTQVGDSKQTLTIASNAVFNGRVLVRDSLDVAGTIRVGGALSLPGITVSGTSAFENVQVGNNLSVAGNMAVEGSVTIQKSLSVGAGATFAGPITAPILNIDRLELNKDLGLNRHIDAGGPRPTVSSGTAVGSAGTVSISGTDTAGTVNANFGNSPVSGIIANITFANSFTQTPHVVITPVGSNCAYLNFYINRTTTGFSIGTTNNGPSGQSCAFDYIAID